MTEIEAIEEELSEARADLEDHVDKLADKLTLGRLVDEFVLGGRMNVSAIAGNETLLKLIIPGALVGTGVAMFLAGGGMGKVAALLNGESEEPAGGEGDYQVNDHEAARQARWLDALDRSLVRRPDETDAAYRERWVDEHAIVLDMQKQADESSSSFSDRINSARDLAMTEGAKVVERLNAAAAAEKHGAENAAQFVGDAGVRIENAAGAAKSQYEDNPALGIAIGMAVGALIGSLAPMSQKEQEVLAGPVGEAADKLASGAKSAEQTAQRAAQTLPKNMEASWTADA